jgi:hypothetical protein
MSKFNLKKFILEGKLNKNLQQLNENSPGFDNRKFGDPLPTLESVKTAFDENKLLTDVEEDFILKVAGEVDGEGMAQIAGALGIDTSEIDLDDEMLLDDLYVDIEMAVKNASAKEIIRLANELKGLNEEDAVSWKYNNSPARGGTLDLAPRKVGQSIKENIDMDKIFMKGRGDRKVDSKMWSRMDDEHQMDALLSVFKDPDDAEMYVGEKWDDLPEEKNFMITTIKPLSNEAFNSSTGGYKAPPNPVSGDVSKSHQKAVTIRGMMQEKIFSELKDELMDLSSDRYEVDGTSVGDGKYKDEESIMQGIAGQIESAILDSMGGDGKVNVSFDEYDINHNPLFTVYVNGEDNGVVTVNSKGEIYDYDYDFTLGYNPKNFPYGEIEEIEEQKVKEQYSTMGEYVDKMDLDDHLDNIHYEFEKFQAMTTTDIKDIKPAKEELISYVVDYLRNTL